jgi:hypothetical protein
MGSQPWGSRPFGRTSTSWSLPGVKCFIIHVSIDTVLVVTCGSKRPSTGVFEFKRRFEPRSGESHLRTPPDPLTSIATLIGLTAESPAGC